jgi:hypothetical protein
VLFLKTLVDPSFWETHALLEVPSLFAPEELEKGLRVSIYPRQAGSTGHV